MTRLTLLALLVLSWAVRAEERPGRTYRASVVAFAGCAAADAASSIGRYEANPALRGADGKFGGRGIAIKALITGAMLAPQLVLRRLPRKPFTIVNFAAAGTWCGAAIHNVRIEKR